MGAPPLHFSTVTRDLEITDILVCTSTGGRSTNKRDDTPLLDAVGTDKLDLVEILVNKGADVNEVDSEEHRCC